MSRATCTVLVDLAAFVAGAAVVATGLVMKYVLPPCETGGDGGTLLGWGRHDWGGLHFVLAVALGLLVVLHVAMHWGWVCATVGRAAGRGGAEGGGRALAGGAAVIVLAAATGGVVWAGRAAVVRGNGGCPGSAQGCGAAKAVPACATCPGAAKAAPACATCPGVTEARTAPAGVAGICGSMTIDEAARQAGCDAGRLRRLLGLPDDVGAGERLRDVIPRAGLTMPEVRRRLEAGR